MPQETQVRRPLSFGQEQLWFVDQLAPGQTTYNVTGVYRVRGVIDAEALRAALTMIVRRHEELRATFHADDDGAPYALISEPSNVDLVITDLSEVPPDKQEDAAQERLAAAVRPFDLGAGPLYRYELIRLAPDHQLIMVDIHHMIMDGWSIGILNEELATIYEALLAGTEPVLPELEARYADFVSHQRKLITDGELEQQLDYWEKQLANPPVLELPTDRARPAERSFKGDWIGADLSELLPGVRAFAADQGVLPFTVVVAALAVVLSRYSGQHDFTVGTPTPGRPEPEWERLIGLFISVVVLRLDTSGDPTFTELLERVGETLFDAWDNADVPFDQVVDRVQPVRDAGRNPLFQVSCQLLSGALSGAPPQLAGLQLEPVAAPITNSRFDLGLTFSDVDGLLRLEAEFATDLFDRWRVEAFPQHLAQVITVACENPELRVSELPLLDTAERDALLAAGHGEGLSYGPEPVHALVAERAAAQPDHPAWVFRGESLSYGELDHRAGRLARYLRKQGVGPGKIVAVVVERDLDSLVTLLGVLKAGAAYCVLDPRLPTSRLDFILRDTATPLVLTQSGLRAQLPEPAGWQVVELDTQWTEIESATAVDEPLEELADRDSLAYVLYTSGSTGNPKGVLIDHRALISFIRAYSKTFELVPEDRMLQLAALSFDMSQGEIFCGLVAGATLVPVPRDVGEQAETMSELMRSERVTYICMPPAMLSLLDGEPYPELKKIMVGAEKVPAEIVNKWNLPGRRFINVYGPTEATVGCTWYVCEHKVWDVTPPIGVPDTDRDMYIVDERDQLVPRGVPGELLIGGVEGLARGYLNQPELTAQQFTEDPFKPGTGARVYRTGDMVRWNGDYQMEFLGRRDGQIKLRGLRIETGEIESHLLTHPDVSAAVAALRPDRNGDPQIVGYVIPAGGNRPDPAELRRYLRDRLPEHMVPTAWMVMDEFPLTTARKVNRAALPTPEPEDLASVDDFAAPATPTEQQVADIYAEVLAAGAVSAEGSFFDLGGNSLQAMRVVSRLSRAFGVRVSLRVLYGSATVRGVSAAIDELVAARGAGASR